MLAFLNLCHLSSRGGEVVNCLTRAGSGSPQPTETIQKCLCHHPYRSRHCSEDNNDIIRIEARVLIDVNLFLFTLSFLSCCLCSICVSHVFFCSLVFFFLIFCDLTIAVVHFHLTSSVSLSYSYVSKEAAFFFLNQFKLASCTSLSHPLSVLFLSLSFVTCFGCLKMQLRDCNDSFINFCLSLTTQFSTRAVEEMC